MRQAGLRCVFLALMLSLAAPVAAQEPGSDLHERLERFSETAREMFEDLLGEMRPLLEEEVVPLLERLGALVDDLSHYDMPELLPNGDILIRRAPDAPPLQDPQPGIGKDDVEI